MKNNFKNKLAMYKMVRDTISANGPIWEGIPAFVTCVQDFSARVQLLEEKENYQRSISLGVGLVSRNDKKLIFEKLLRVAGGLKAFALDSNNTKLLMEVSIPKSLVNNSSKVDLLSRIDLLISRAQEFGSELGNYGLTPEEVGNLVIFRSEMDATLTAPRKAIIDRKQANAQIKLLFKEIDVILTAKLDSLMFIIKDQHPEFYNAYTDSRMIIDYGKRQTNNDAA